MAETNQKHQVSPIPFTLNLSERGELKISGEASPELLQPILDASHLRASLYQKHQEFIEREANRTALLIGIIFASLLGLFVFCALNTSPKLQSTKVTIDAQSIIS